MNKAIKEKWVAALRSGEYQQCAGALRKEHAGSPDTFCCLGVLCDIVDSKGWRSPYNTLTNKKQFVFNGMHSSNGLTNELRGTLSVNTQEEIELVRLNDNGRDFSYIADFIEEHL